MTIPGQPSTVQVNSADLAYVERGQGVPLIFVHGSLNDYRSWLGQLEPFAEHFHAITYSRRYHWPNAEPAADATYPIAEQVADLAGLIEALELAPAHLVGSSFGAMTALTLAVERPALVRSLVLGEPPLLPWLERVPGGEAIEKQFVTTSFFPAGAAFARGDMEAGVRLFIDGVIGPGAYDRIPPEARQAMLDNAGAEAAETRTPPTAYFPDLAPADVAQLEMPVLLVQGETSPPMFGLITDELARVLPKASRATIAAASHGMHARQPAAYNAAVLAFLAGLDLIQS